MKLIQGSDLVAAITRHVSLQPHKPVKMCTLEWEYVGVLMPEQAIAIVRASACIGWGNLERVKKLAVGARLPNVALSLADRLATMPMWPERDHAYQGDLRILVPLGFLRYPESSATSYQKGYPAFLRDNCGLGTA